MISSGSLPMHSPLRTDENHQALWPVLGRRFEACTFGLNIARYLLAELLNFDKGNVLDGMRPINNTGITLI
jgi:hypothetical protein